MANISDPPSKNNRRAEPLPDNLQDNLLTLLFHDNKVGKLIAETVDPNVFQGEARIFAERAVDYWREYKKAPGAHSPDLFDDVFNDPAHPRRKTYLRHLQTMSELAPRMNSKFIQDQMQKFAQQQEMKAEILNSAEMLSRGQLEQVTENWRTLLDKSPSVGRTLTTRAIDQFEAREVSWLWWPFIPLGMVTMLFGDGGVGKSTLTIDLAARISRGRRLPQFDARAEEPAVSGEVIILSKEDDVSRIIRPRLEVARADLSRVHMVGYAAEDEFDPIDSLDKNVAALERLIEKDDRLIIIDPISDFAGKLDLYRDNEIRSLLTPLSRLAAKHNLAVVLILHMNKKTDLTARHRAMAGVAFVNVPRSAVLVAPDPQDAGRKIVVQVKRNLTGATHSAAAFTMESVGAYARLRWEDQLFEADADALLAEHKPTKRKEAEALLRKWLANGPKMVSELMTLADETEISWRTFNSVKDAAGVLSKKVKNGWRWTLEKD